VKLEAKSGGKPAFPTLSYSHLSALITLKGFHSIRAMKVERLGGREGGLAPALFRKN